MAIQRFQARLGEIVFFIIALMDPFLLEMKVVDLLTDL